MAKATDKSNRYYPKDRKTWRKWLEKNHLTATGIWLIYYKKGSGKPSVPYADAVEEALCFGWIDTTMNPIDDESYMQLFTPRKEKSGWSKLNKNRVERLTAQGLMTPAGIEKIEAAKRHGTWTKLDDVEAFVIPPDLEREFKSSKTAKKFFDSLSNSNRKMILYYINNVKKQELRAKRIVEMIEPLKEGRLPDRYAPKSKS